MTAKKTARRAGRKGTLTSKEALTAARAARKAYAIKGRRPAAWKRGGREWTRVLGHFSVSPRTASKK